MNDNIVVVYTGRFQPALKHHAKVYDFLCKKFGKDNVYVGTSNKVEPDRSPFIFDEKKKIIHKIFNIPENRIIQIVNPYSGKELIEKTNKDPEKTALIVAVGKKDAERLSPDKPKKNGEPGYYLTYNKRETELEPAKKNGYVIIIPNVETEGKVVSATEARELLKDPSISEERRWELFQLYTGTKDKELYDLFKYKLGFLKKKEE